MKLLLLLAALHVGIGENKPDMFRDPLFSSLGVKQVRLVVSYDVMTSGDDELQRVTEYLLAARAAGIEPLVTFEHARGAAELCEKRKNRRKRNSRSRSTIRRRTASSIPFRSSWHHGVTRKSRCRTRPACRKRSAMV